MIVPGPGFVAVFNDINDTADFVVLGPIPVGSFLERVEARLSGAERPARYTGDVALSLGASSEASAVALNAGQDLIDVSNLRTLGQNTIRFQFANTGGERSVVVPVGIEIKGGPKWLVVAGLISDILNMMQ